jgi:hypothetical protein
MYLIIELDDEKTMIHFLTIAYTFLVLFCILSVDTFGQSTNRTLPTKMLPFNDPLNGIQLNYPSDWSVKKEDDRATFVSPDSGLAFAIQIVNLSENLSMPLSSVPQFKSLVLSQILSGFELVENSTLILSSNHSAKKMVFSFSGINYATNQTILGNHTDWELLRKQLTTLIFTIQNDKMYTFLYTLERSEYDKYLPLIQTIIQSISLKPES